MKLERVHLGERSEDGSAVVILKFDTGHEATLALRIGAGVAATQNATVALAKQLTTLGGIREGGKL